MTGAILPLVWYVLILAEIALYVLLDGANLGIGILTLLPQREVRRSLILHALSPLWNANETWLLVAAGSLFGAFPMVFAVGLNALYLPGMVILAGIILRAVSFEFHAYATHKRVWSFAFGVGSLCIAAGQGVALGALLNGIPIADGHFAGGAYTFASPLAWLFMVGVTASYIVLGYGYLLRYTEYDAGHDMFRGVVFSALMAFAALLAATFLLPMHHFVFVSRWSTPPWNYVLYAIGACIAIAVTLLLWDALRRQAAHVYGLSLTILVLGTLGLLVGIYPYIMLPDIPYWSVASPDSTLQFMLWGIAPILPIILVYNWYLARIFRDAHTEGGGEY